MLLVLFSHVVLAFENVTSAELIENETRRVKPSDWLIHKRSSNGTDIQTSILVWLFGGEGYVRLVIRVFIIFFQIVIEGIVSKRKYGFLHILISIIIFWVWLNCCL